MGHPKRKPTTLGVNDGALMQLDGVCGAPSDEAESAARYRAMSLPKRFNESQSWSSWAPGLKEAIAQAINNHVLRVESELFSVRSQALSSAGDIPGRDPNSLPSRALRSLSRQALESWKEHFLNDHQPSRRDCVHCVRSQGRGKQHRRVTHPDAYTLSVDLSGKMTAGLDQGSRRCRYLMVACYTFPVTRRGEPLLQPPGQDKDPKDHPLPSMDLHGGGVPGSSDQVPPDDWCDDEDVVMGDEGGDAPPTPEESSDLPEPEDPLREQSQPEDLSDGPAQEAMRGAFNVWERLVDDATDVAVKNLTFVEVLNSRAVGDVLPALARIHARLQALGLPLLRLHCDKARELTSAPVRRWTLDRGIITTLTTGSSYKSNGRVEAEVGNTKRAIRTLVSAKLCPLEFWPLAARHIGERRLRNQLQRVGWPAAPMLNFGCRAFALRKSWQERYSQWRDAREEIIVMGPDKCSSLTTTSYYVRSVSTGKFFFTDDVIKPPEDAPLAVPDLPYEDQPVIYLEERGDQPNPVPWTGVPTRRLRGKTTVPAIQSLCYSEGEGDGDVLPADQTSASSLAETPTLQSDFDHVEEVGGGDEEGAPKNRAGGSYPVASKMSGIAAIRAMHGNVANYINDEMQRLDATSEEQAMWIGALSDAIMLKLKLETQLQTAQCNQLQDDQLKVEQEFLVAKTVSNQEVWNNLEDWSPSIHKEFNQLVHIKKAVRQVTKDELRQMADQMGVGIETLPGKMVHVRKPGGVYKTRAVICGNYADGSHDNQDYDTSTYAGGVDGQQVRTMIKLGALKGWLLGSTDIATAFLNAPRRESKRLIAMEVPAIFRRLGLAESHHMWVVEKALYGLTSSPRDWAIYRDEELPKMVWKRRHQDQPFTGSFQKTPDDNIWRMVETNDVTGEQHWVGLMSIYVDDLLFAAEKSSLEAAARSIENVWTLSPLETTEEGKVIKYCGFELEKAPCGDGFLVSQRKYEKEMLQRFGIEKSTVFPNFRLTEEDEFPGENLNPVDIKTAQSMAGALLWLTTRTRPDIALSVAAACRLTTKNPLKSIEISTAVMSYIHGVQGGLHYAGTIPEDDWGKRQQLKVKRHDRLLEVFSDIAFGVGSRHRSLQGLIVYFAGSPVAWGASQQPFVTYSTAEAELVSYGEGLNAGRAMLAMICSMLNEPPQSVEKILYGDNAAAISLAHGTGTSSWRTRHLRVRASFLREALDGVTPDGLWKLFHLRGTELVADGLTKPLYGQAFARFLQDLGMESHEVASNPLEDEHHVSGGGDNSVAVRALVLGSALLATAEGASDDQQNDSNLTVLWLVGVTLMTLGSIYLGRLLHDAGKFCLKRLRTLEEVAKRLERQDDVSDDESVIVISGDEIESSTTMTAESAPEQGLRTTSTRRRSGSMMRRDQTTSCDSSSRMTSQSGHSTGKGSGSSMSRNTPSRSGSSTGKGSSSATSLRTTTRSGPDALRTAGNPAAAAAEALVADESSEGALVVGDVESVSDEAHSCAAHGQFKDSRIRRGGRLWRRVLRRRMLFANVTHLVSCCQGGFEFSCHILEWMDLVRFIIKL
eukprot:s2475_g4.t1